MAVDIEAAGDTPVVGIAQPLFQSARLAGRPFHVTSSTSPRMASGSSSTPSLKGLSDAPITFSTTAELEP